MSWAGISARAVEHVRCGQCCGWAGANDAHACIALSQVSWSTPGGDGGRRPSPEVPDGGGPAGGSPAGGPPSAPGPPGPPWDGAGTPLSVMHWLNASCASAAEELDAADVGADRVSEVSAEQATTPLISAAAAVEARVQRMMVEGTDDSCCRGCVFTS